MNDDLETIPVTQQPWWRDRAILVGVIGVIATIVVGLVTYWLTAGTESREYQERVRAARSEIISSVSRSIGEGKVPNKAKIQAVINSVERQNGVKQQDSQKPEVVIDDIIERVLANEFLDAQKREELSSKLLAMRDEPVQVPVVTESQQTTPRTRSTQTFSLEVAVVAAFFTAFASFFGVLRERNTELSRRIMPIILTLLLMITFLVILFVTPPGQNIIKALQTR